MGIQNATARKLAVPDLTTTVLTLTITGMAAEQSRSRLEPDRRRGAARGGSSPILVGALAGAALALHVFIVSPFAVAPRRPHRRTRSSVGGPARLIRPGYTRARQDGWAWRTGQGRTCRRARLRW